MRIPRQLGLGFGPGLGPGPAPGPGLLLALLVAGCGVGGGAGGVSDDAGGRGGGGRGGAGGGLAVGDADVTKVDPGKEDSSAEAVFLDFTFEAALRTTWATRPEAQIEDQLLYTIGQLNGERAVGRLDRLILSDIRTEEVTGDTGAAAGGTKISYKATLLVAWGRRTAVPATYTFRLPVDVSYPGQDAFTQKYGQSCVDWGAHDVTAGSMWYYYRPGRSGCSLDAGDVVDAKATVAVSTVQTAGKYPEYDKVWEDGTLNVVAVFGKYEDGATSGDGGISAYGTFNKELRRRLRGRDPVITPADTAEHPGIETPEVRYEARLDAGHAVTVTALLVDNVRTAGPAFDARYAELSATADLIVYNGHAGLGANVRALAAKGTWRQGQYVIVFMNGCDTYAYVDDALFAAHAAVNPDDPKGTRHVDIVTNAMPSFFASMAEATLAIVDGLMSYEVPRTYERIFSDVDSAQVILVSGEDDNTFVPGGDGGGGDGGDGGDGGGGEDGAWPGLSEEGTVARGEERRFETPRLAAGRYSFKLSGDGDADLYVRIGQAPTMAEYDCRPYKSGSDEACSLSLPGPSAIHGMIRGYADSSNYALVATPE